MNDDVELYGGQRLFLVTCRHCGESDGRMLTVIELCGDGPPGTGPTCPSSGPLEIQRLPDVQWSRRALARRFARGGARTVYGTPGSIPRN
jgi:hypothetical protein